MRFDGFYGNNRAKQLLAGEFDAGRPPHAVLIDGPEGSGKRTLALIVARAALCMSQDEKPCGKCRQCQNALQNCNPDITVYSGAGGARSFSVDTVRAIRADASLPPNDADKKVYILTNVHEMSDSAQNALLKILEEPPSYVMFVLTCAGSARVLDTVRSRCFSVSIGPVPADDAVSALMAADKSLGRERAMEAAALSGGIIGRAMQYLSGGGLSRTAEISGRFAKTLCGSDEYEFLKVSGSLCRDTELGQTFIELSALVFRDACMRKAGTAGGLSGCTEAVDTLSGALTSRQLCALMERALDFGKKSEKNLNRQLMYTAYFAALWEDAHAVTGI